MMTGRILTRQDYRLQLYPPKGSRIVFLMGLAGFCVLLWGLGQ